MRAYNVKITLVKYTNILYNGIVLGIIITILAAVFSVAFMSELANYY